jgi:two-component system, NtrC family, response regulator GlrR
MGTVVGGEPQPKQTQPLEGGSFGPAGQVQRFVLVVVEPTRLATTWNSVGDRCSIGSERTNDLVIDHNTISRFHCEIVIGENGARVIDMKSRNGTIVDGVRVQEAWLRNNSLLRLGMVSVRFQYVSDSNQLVLSQRQEFGGLVGRSAAMRASFALLERAALTDATVLLEGETGTGKGAAAEAVHQASARRDQPFVIVDCGAIPANLLESELFGHEKGAFTGADSKRVGAFEEADGGTVFLDEIGELPADLQPKLLRVLESRTIRRIGQNVHKNIDVRLIAATHRDLRADVNSGRFRADLYYRLAVLRVSIPPLRARPDDLPAIAEHILKILGASAQQREHLLTLDLISTLQRSAWPGNVRELRNYLERCLVFERPLPPDEPQAQASSFAIDVSRPLADERQRMLDEFEREYVERLLRAHNGKVAQAASAAKIGRVHLYRMMRRLGISPR